MSYIDDLKEEIVNWFDKPESHPKKQSMYQFTDAKSYYEQLLQLTTLMAYLDIRQEAVEITVKEYDDKIEHCTEVVNALTGRVEANETAIASLADTVEQLVLDVANKLDIDLATLSATGEAKIKELAETEEIKTEVNDKANKDLSNISLRGEQKINTIQQQNFINVFSTEFMNSAGFHNSICRGKNITSYVTDGSLWDRINGTNGYALFEDIFVGDYIEMSRPISAYEQTQTYQATGTKYVTIADIDGMMGSGDSGVGYHHLVMIPGRLNDTGANHFGRSRMNSSNTTVGGYVASEMHTTTLGAIATSGSTETTATINQQLFAEFGSHLKTTKELLSTGINATGYNRRGEANGTANSWAWTSCQAVLMSEVEVYGSIVASSSLWDTGNANKQLSIFRFSKQMINNRSSYYWLKDINSAYYFCLCGNNGDAYYDSASRAYRYVRPRFILGA